MNLIKYNFKRETVNKYFKTNLLAFFFNFNQIKCYNFKSLFSFTSIFRQINFVFLWFLLLNNFQSTFSMTYLEEKNYFVPSYKSSYSQVVSDTDSLLNFYSNKKDNFSHEHSQKNLKFLKSDQHSLRFTLEPSPNIFLPNDKDYAIKCEASGQPMPKINWVKEDNSELENVGNLRKISTDGSLVFSKFSQSKFRPEIHNAAYKCVASNNIGQIISRTTRVRANVVQPYDLQVYDDFVIRGNIGVLRCHIPAFIKDYIKFTNWVRNDGLIISVNSLNENRYMAFEGGELHISQVDPVLDSQYQYICQTKSLINGEIKQSSNSGRLIITEPHTNVPPKITDRKPYIVANKGERVLLPCASQALPVPQTFWYYVSNHQNLSLNNDGIKDNEKKNFKLVLNNFDKEKRFHQWNSNLIIERANYKDSGKYICKSINNLGEDVAETELLVKESLNVSIAQKIIESQENDQNVSINCTVQGFPVRRVLWYKNGLVLNEANSMRIRTYFDHLFFKHIKREDRGMYQCVALNEFESATASVEVVLSDEPARLIETFSSDSLLLRPGDKLSLKCVATGNPLPQITWTLDGQPIAEQHRLRVGDYVNADGFVNSFVNISSLKPEDGGVYECSALNLIPLKSYSQSWPFENRQNFYISSESFNSPIYSQLQFKTNLDIIARHKARINVFGPPSVRKMNNITVVSGDSLYINCPVFGYPIKEIRWYKGDIKLPENHKQHVYSNGTLIIHQLEKANDEDEYRCVVFGASLASQHYEPIYSSNNDQISNINFDYQKLTASETVYVKVIVAPLISPFFAPPNLREGMRNMLTCSVLEGDPPFKIEWYKNSQLIISSFDSLNNSNIQEDSLYLTSNRLKVSSNNEFSSTLFFTNVSYEDNGNYTCMISNTVASANHTVNMMVKVPPKWIQIPSNTEAVVGQDLLLHCQASGYPTVRTWWEFQNSNIDQQLTKTAIGHNQSPSMNKATYQNVISNSHIHTLENGTLIIRELSKSDEGHYLCQATNGVGSGISKVISLNVHVPAHFQSSFKTETMKKNENIEILCEAFGEPPITINWYYSKNGQRVPLFTNNDKLKNILSKDNYSERVFNDVFLQIMELNLSTATEAKYKLIEKSGSLNEIKIENSINTDEVILGSKKRIKTSNKQNKSNLSSHSYINILQINKVDRKDSGMFTCAASNLYGKDEYNVQIILQERPDKPENVQASQIDSRTAMITWTVPYSGNSLILSYQAQVKKSSEIWSDLNEINQFETSNGNVNFIAIRKLKPLTKYEVRVRCENALGFSEWSDTIAHFITKEEAPNRPPIDINIYPNSKQLLIRFRPPENTETVATIKGYHIGFRILDKSEETSKYTFKTLKQNEINIINNEKPLEVKLTDLKRATKYGIIIQAFNDKGTGPSSEEIQVITTELDPPEAPQLVVTTSSNSTIHLTWQPSLTDENPIDGYLLFQKEENLLEWKEYSLEAQQTHYTTLALKCGTRYQFYLVAFNKQGKGEPSQVVSARTKGSEPKPPSVKDFIQCNSTMVILQMKNWQSNGCEIHSFIVQYRILRKPSIFSNKIQSDFSKNGQAKTNRLTSPSQMFDDWVLISNNILADGRNVEIFELQPANWYSLLISAQTDMGLSEKEYIFSTLTLDGATIAPFEATELGQNRLIHNSYSLIIPSLCAFLLLIILIFFGFFTFCKRNSKLNQTKNNAQLNSFTTGTLTPAQHFNTLNVLSTYATPALHQSTGSNNCVHLEEHLEHSLNCNIGEDHILTDACFHLNTAKNSNLLNNYSLNTFDHVQTNFSSNQNEQLKDVMAECQLLPSPYATNQIEYDCVLKQTSALQNPIQTNSIQCNQHYSRNSISNLNQQFNTQNFNFDHLNNCSNVQGTGSEHTYDVPIPPKWV